MAATSIQPTASPSPLSPIHLFHHSFRRGGGMERYAMMLAGTLKALGCQVVVHARRADEAAASALGVKLDTIRVPPFPRKLQDFHFFRKVDQIRRETDGLQIALTRVRIRDLVVCGGTHRGYLSRARKLPGPFDWLQIWMETESYRSARTIVSHSQLCAEELVRCYRVPADKIVTLYPPVDDGFTPVGDDHQRAESRRRWGLPEDKVVFLFPSTGHRRKGFKPICQALRGLADQLVLAVAGRPPGGRAWPFVRYLGYVENMAAAYRAADFTILGSYYEPFGLVGVESISCGTRLVFEEHIGCLEAVQPEFATTFSVRNPDSIRCAVETALDLARKGGHHFSQPAKALRYSPCAAEHAQALLRVAQAQNC